MTNVLPLHGPRGPRPPPTSDPRSDFVYRITKNGRDVDETVVNAIVVFRRDPAWEGVIAYNELSNMIVARKPPPWYDVDARAIARPGEWTDTDTTRAQSYLRRKWSINLGKDGTRDAIAVAADACAFNPVKEWIDPIEWDGIARVGRPSTEGDPGVKGWLHTYMRAEDSAYSRSIGRWHLIASVARVYSPGEKVDTTPIAEAPEGKKKSQTLKALYHPFFSDTPINLRSKDKYEALLDVWCIELAEFNQYDRHDEAALRAFASSSNDKFRRAYQRADTRNPRRCVFLASVNPGKQYFNGEGADRRWQPFVSNVDGRDCDVEGIWRDRDQLWAEARELYLGWVRSRDIACRWWPETRDEKRMCFAEIDARKSLDVWFNGIAAHVAHHKPGAIVKSEDILSGHLSIERGKWTDKEKQRVEKCLRQLGWVHARASTPDSGGNRPTHYRLPKSEEAT